MQDTHKFVHLCFHGPLQIFLYVKSPSIALFIDTSLAVFHSTVQSFLVALLYLTFKVLVTVLMYAHGFTWLSYNNVYFCLIYIYVIYFIIIGVQCMLLFLCYLKIQPPRLTDEIYQNMQVYIEYGHLLMHIPLYLIIYISNILPQCPFWALYNQGIVVRLGSYILYFHLFISYLTSLRQDPSYILLILHLCRPLCMTYKFTFVIFIHICTWKVTFIITVITSSAAMLFLH